MENSEQKDTSVTPRFGTKPAIKKSASDLNLFREQTLRNCKKYSPIWWDVVSTWLQQEENNEYKKLAVIEFNKLQVKALPTDLKLDPGGDVDVGVIILPNRRERNQGEPLPVEIPDKPKYSPLFMTTTTDGKLNQNNEK